MITQHEAAKQREPKKGLKPMKSHVLCNVNFLGLEVLSCGVALSLCCEVLSCDEV